MNTLKLSFVLLIFTLISCGPQVQTTKKDDVNLNSYKSFAFLPNANVPSNDSDIEETDEAVVKSVNFNMKQLGYILDRENPDLLVLVSTKATIEQGTTTEPVYATYPYAYGATNISPYYRNFYYNSYASYGNFVGYDTDTYSYKEGTVVVDVIDRKTRETVWKGVTSDNIYDIPSIEARGKMVSEIFDEYPIKQSK